MTTALARPRRKGAGNKNYSDAYPEQLLEALDPPAGLAATKNSNSARGKKPSARGSATTPTPISTGRLPFNWQPPAGPGDYFSQKLNLEGAYINTRLQTLYCPEHPYYDSKGGDRATGHVQLLLSLHPSLAGTARAASRRRATKEPYFCLKKGDYIYMVSEPPGEPYYIGRVMGFTRKSKQDLSEEEPELVDASLYVFQIQWFYRPRDISKHTSDSRLLYASMHSDTCPLQSFRGLVTVKHKAEIDLPPGSSKENTPMSALEAYCSIPNCFYFDKLFDRYMIKFYDIIKTSMLLQYVSNAANNSQHYILALNKRFEFIFMEPSRSKQFINNFDSTLSSHCDICSEWCATNESVTCAGCEKHFHMLCLDPPLLKKPSRGFSWSCALCTKKHELEYQSKKMVMLSHDNKSSNEKEISETSDTIESTPEEALEEEAPKRKTEKSLPKYEQMAKNFLIADAALTVEDRRLKEEWSMRYLGVHTRLEDAVDLDDRSPYPRASTSLGPKYQASNIPEYIDHPIVYYDDDKATENGKKKAPAKKGNKRKTVEEQTKPLPLPKQFQDVPRKEFPQWLQPRPKGYIERGVDDGEGETCTLLWKNREEDLADNFAKFDDYVRACNPIAQKLNMYPTSPNFVDAILKIYYDCDGDTIASMEQVSKLTRASLKEPTFTAEEIRRFENGVKKYGSELYPTYKLVKSQPCSMVVRFYYLWKKTPRGRQIWGNFPGRKKKPNAARDEKPAKEFESLADDEDDSSYENEKIVIKHRKFRCKHCKTYKSVQWFKITGFDEKTVYDDSIEDDVDPDAVNALCFRCAKLWRRYAVYWEDPQEVERKNTKGVGGYRRKVEAELVADAEKILARAQQEGGGLSYDIVPPRPGESCVLITDGFRPTTLDGNFSGHSRRLSGLNSLAAIPTPRASTIKTSTAKAPTSRNRLESNNVKAPATVQKPSQQIKTISSPAKSRQRANGTPVKTDDSLETKRKPLQSTNGKAKAEPKAKPKKKPSAVKEESKDNVAGAKVEKTQNGTTKKPSNVGNTKKRALLEDQSKNAEGYEKVQPPKTKRQKRQTPSETMNIVSPILNPDYIVPANTISKVDKKMYPALNENVLKEIITNFKTRQLVDLKLLTLAFQAPSQSAIELPFSVNDRNCCICMEYDDKDDSLLEMLICSNCGVNVHSTCAGIAISGKQKPVKQWLCDACVNDLSPQYSTTYSCSLCLANEMNYEYSILGSPSVKPDYLTPVLDSGKWVHLLCALFSHNQVSFRNILPPSFISKEVMNCTSTRHVGCAVESVSNVFVENYTSRCGICKSYSGAMITCDACRGEKYHITCAQDTPNFKLGFKLVPQKISRASTNTYIGEETGKLEPVLLCPRHDQRNALYNMRALGKRTLNGELKPLMQLFIEDICRLANHRLTGPQLKAHNYMKMIEKFTQTEEELAAKARESGLPQKNSSCNNHVCEVCKLTASPKWWPSPEKPNAFRCHSCHHLNDMGRIVEADAESAQLVNELNEPIRAEHFGLKEPLDHISKVYKPVDGKPNVERSMITLSEILW